MAFMGSADGMALSKIMRHFHEDYELMDLDDVVQDKR